MYNAALCRKIRAFDRDTPIIICAGDTKESKQESALCVGCTVFISKLGIDKLLDQVKAELEF
jgi:CheY-like chemotaxis protein